MEQETLTQFLIPKNLINGSNSVSNELDSTLEGIETVEKEFNLFQLGKEKVYWTNRVNALIKELIEVAPKLDGEKELQEYVVILKAALANRAMVKEMHSKVNVPIYNEIYYRENCQDLQKVLFEIGQKYGSKKQFSMKARVSKLIGDSRERKIVTEGILTGYNSKVKVKLNLFKI